MNIAGQCLEKIQERFSYHCPYLFVDEAHHIAATTWKQFKDRFMSQRILQFTATPFRNDDKPIDGEIIFNYPLKKAQEEGYFTHINFSPIEEYDHSKSDLMIAKNAITQLRKDTKRNHIVMARTANIKRAMEVFNYYKGYKEFNPVQLHTGIKSSKEREKIRQMILKGDSKIVVCVDMLGEGFDLPELKIAAFHDIKKSLPVTLQLAGRFTRTKPNLGEATFIANIADPDVDEELSNLYRNDSDWNVILRRSSQQVIQEQISFKKFIEGFDKLPEDVPLENLRPAMSTAIYKTECKNWTPQNFKNGIEGIDSFERVHYRLNNLKNTLVIITAKKFYIDWAHFRDIFTWNWELYILFWDKTQQLLFIHSSSNVGYYKKLAEAVAGKVELVNGPSVFRCFSGINRLKLQNVGLIEMIGRYIRYTMRAGSDVEPGLTEAQKRTVIKSNIFGNGFEDGSKTTIGCSYKGRIWSYRTANIEELIQWNKSIGQKVTDTLIDPNEVLKGTLVTVIISRRPNKMPISIEWPTTIISENERFVDFLIDDVTNIPLYQTDINLVNPTESGDLIFEICSNSLKARFILTIFQKNKTKDYRFSRIGSSKATIRQGSVLMPLEEYFYDNPPMIWFSDGSCLEGNKLVEIRTKYNPYPTNKILTWDWTGVDIKKESQGIKKEKDSIQYRVIQQLKNDNYDLIFDDDGSGEAADVIAIQTIDKPTKDRSISVRFYHCKFSSDAKPGSRINDLYALCGQAQKCIHWAEKPTELFTHMLRREPMKEKGKQRSRFEKGDRITLNKIREMSRILPMNLEIFIVQPGLLKSAVSQGQQELLSVTENYLMETYKLPFGIIASNDN